MSAGNLESGEWIICLYWIIQIQIIYTLLTTLMPTCTLYSTYSLLNGEFITLYFHFYAIHFSKHFHNKISISISSIPTIHWLEIDPAPATTQRRRRFGKYTIPYPAVSLIFQRIHLKDDIQHCSKVLLMIFILVQWKNLIIIFFQQHAFYK